MSITSIVYETVRRPVIYLGFGITVLTAVACSGEAIPASAPQPPRIVIEASATPRTLDEAVVVLTPETSPEPAVAEPTVIAYAESTKPSSPDPEPLEATVAAEVASVEPTTDKAYPESTEASSPEPAPSPSPSPSPEKSPTAIVEPTNTPEATATSKPTPIAIPVPTPDAYASLINQLNGYKNSVFHTNFSQLDGVSRSNQSLVGQLAGYAAQDLELTKRVLIATNTLGYGISEATEYLSWTFDQRVQNGGFDDPDGFADVHDLRVGMDAAYAVPTLVLADGSKVNRLEYLRNNPNALTTLFAIADIESWKDLPEDMFSETALDWFSERFPNATPRISNLVFGGNYSQTVSAKPNNSLSPIFDDHELVNLLERSRFSNPVGYAQLSAERAEWLSKFDFVATDIQAQVEALARGNLDKVGLLYELKLSEGAERDWSQITRDLIDYHITNKADQIAALDVRTRAFVTRIGDLDHGMKYGSLDKSNLYNVSQIEAAGAFRVLGRTDFRFGNRLIYPEVDTNNIELYVKGSIWRNSIDKTTGDPNYQPESLGLVVVSPENVHPLGEITDQLGYTTYKGGTVFSTGEPQLVPNESLRYPFFDRTASEAFWDGRTTPLSSKVTYGVAYILNPAKIGSPFNHWELVLDNRKDNPDNVQQ